MIFLFSRLQTCVCSPEESHRAAGPAPSCPEAWAGSLSGIGRQPYLNFAPKLFFLMLRLQRIGGHQADYGDAEHDEGFELAELKLGKVDGDIDCHHDGDKGGSCDYGLFSD